MRQQLTFATIGGEIVTREQRGRHYIQPKGYAYFPGTGPEGETCGTCAYIQRWRKWAKCGHEFAVPKHTGGRGSDVLCRSPACKYWKAAEEA